MLPNTAESVRRTACLLAALLAAPATVAWEIDPGLAQACPALVKAKEAAKATVNSPEGVDCFLHGPLDNPTDPSTFDDDDEGPEIKVMDLSMYGAYGVFDPMMPDCIFVDEQLKVDAEAGDVPSQMVLEATIVHETTHWQDDKDGHHTPPEAGCAMETWIYGFPKVIENAMGTTLGGTTAAGALHLQLANTKTSYAPGEPVVLRITLTNQSSQTLSLLDFFGLEAGMLWFRVTAPSGKEVAYQGPHIKVRPSDARVRTLAPGQSLTRLVELNGERGGYPLPEIGSHRVTVQYRLPDFGTPFLGREDFFVGTTESNRIGVLVRGVNGMTPQIKRNQR